VRASGRDRSELIVTSKLPGRHHDPAEARVTIEESVYRTGLDYLDLYLIHWPNPITDRYVEAWTALIEAQQRGLVRSIGVCNFLPEHLDRLQRETGVLPAVNQVELHPYFPQAEQLAYDAGHGILTESWSPLGRGNDLLNNPTVVRVAETVGATPGQVVLAWHLARGAVPVPKAASDARQIENLGALDVTRTPPRATAFGCWSTGCGRAASGRPTRTWTCGRSRWPPPPSCARGSTTTPSAWRSSRPAIGPSSTRTRRSTTCAGSSPSTTR
jgi:diketogulonate reductase-like aldo/keto reductase